MFKHKEKIQNRIREIEQYRYRNIQHLESFNCIEDIGREVTPALPEFNDGNYSQINVGEKWSGRDLYLWLNKKISIPSEWQNQTVVGLFDFGNTGGGNNSGFESLLYIDENCYQGVDANHKEVFFKHDQIGKTFNLTFRLWSGLEGGGEPRVQEHEIKRAEIAILDEKVDDLYYTSKVMLQTIDVLPDCDYNKVTLLSELNNAFKMISWEVPGSKEFYQSLHKASEYLEQAVDNMDKSTKINVTCIGHTHIDVAWLWRLKHTREKCARSFSTVIRLMEQYPDYVFLQTQPQLYEYIKNDYPEIYEEIKEKVADGKWEVDGAMWVEADCNVPSGESLVRQILVGSRFVKEEFKKETNYLWLPDVFGYSWALPQILKKSNIGTFMTTKISWNQYNRIPHDTFNWRGIDGSEILAHFITTPEPGSDKRTFFSTYNGYIEPFTAKGLWEKYQDKSLNQDLLLSYGYGDGGGGVNRDMLENRRRCDKMPGLPHIKTGTAREYFEKLQDNVKNTNEYIHTWDGELYLEYHRGTYTSQAHNKKMNRKLELLYRKAEWMNVLNSINNNDWANYPQAELLEGWKIILRNQFHDIIPGSSIHEVYEDSRVEYNEAEEIGNKAISNIDKTLVQESQNTWTVFNDSSWSRTDKVDIEMDKNLSGNWYDDKGNKLVSEKYDMGYRVIVENIPSMGWTTINFKEDDRDEKVDAFSWNKNTLETPHYVININENGQIENLFDKENDRVVTTDEACVNVLQVFEDKPLAHDAWDIDIFYQEKVKEITNIKSVELIENGDIQGVLRFVWNYDDSTITQDMTVYKHSKRIDFVTNVDWNEKNQLLKVAFPVNIRSNKATYQIQYGNVERPTHWNTSWDMARFESVGHQWADLSERDYGVSLMNDSKYGYDIKDNVLRLSLIKSATYPDPTQDQGEHNFTYSILPHSGDFVSGNVEQEAWSLNGPLMGAKGELQNSSKSTFVIDNEFVAIDAVKKSEDDNYVILRMHEFSGATQKINVSSEFEVVKWQECDLMENGTDEWSSKAINLTIKPYEIKTLKLELK